MAQHCNDHGTVKGCGDRNKKDIDKLDDKVTDIDVHKMSIVSFRYIFGLAMTVIFALMYIVNAKADNNNNLYHRIDKNIAIIAEAVNVELPLR